MHESLPPAPNDVRLVQSSRKGPHLRRSAGRLLLSSAVLSGLLCVASISPAFADPAFVAECLRDADCAEGFVCGGYECVEQSRVCTGTEDCGDGEICDFFYAGCSSECGTDCDARCEVPHGQCVSSAVVCTSDFDCPEQTICVATRRPDCTADDAECEATVFSSCTDYLRFCDPEQPDPDACYPGDVCASTGRCSAPDLQEENEAIEVDPERDEAVKFSPSDEAGGCSVSSPSVFAGGSTPRSATWWLLAAGALAWSVRRRRVAR